MVALKGLVRVFATIRLALNGIEKSIEKRSLNEPLAYGSVFLAVENDFRTTARTARACDLSQLPLELTALKEWVDVLRDIPPAIRRGEF